MISVSLGDAVYDDASCSDSTESWISKQVVIIKYH